VRIGVLGNEWWPPVEGLPEKLRSLGYVEGIHFRIEHRWARGRNERNGILAAELVALPVDVIVTWGTPAGLAARRATSTIPIVSVAGDLVAVGLVSNYARPEANVTGFSTAALDLDVKRLELLKEVVPSASLVAVLINPTNPALDITRDNIAKAASRLGIHARFLDVRDSGDIENALQAIRQSPPDAIQVIADPFLGGHLEAIVAFARETRLPAMYPFRHGAEAGGLISYAADYRDLFRRAAGYIDRIIKGTPLVALPVEYPAKFELLLNISTAKALGLTLPSSLLARADEVIE
jgi:putative ABC transport system substrate-binding protein